MSAKESAYGFLNLLGETTDTEWARQVGEDGVIRAKSEQQEYGHILTDYKDVNGFGDAVDFVSNNFALSLPYLLGIAGSAGAAAVAGPALGLGAAGTFALGISAPSAIYSGQTWNEMEGEKSAAWALSSGVAQAALDRLGLSYLIGKGLGGKASKDLLTRAVKELVKKGDPEDIAQSKVAAATKRELAGFIGDAAKVASEQLNARDITKNFIKNLVVAGGTEAGTEALQESTGYLSAVQGSDKVFDATELTNRVINASLAGGSIGGAISVPGTVADTAGWVDVKYALSPEDKEKQTQLQVLKDKEIADHGYVRTTGEVLEAQSNVADSVLAGAADEVTIELDSAAAADAERRKNQSVQEEAVERVSNIQSLWQGTINNILPVSLQEKYEPARILAEVLGGNAQNLRTLAGPSYENFKHHTVTAYKNYISDNLFETFNKGKRVSRADKERISNNIYNTLQNAVDKDGNLDSSLIPDSNPDKALILAYGKEFQRLGDKIWADQKKYNPELGYTKNYLFKAKSINAKAVSENKKGFIDALVKEYKISRDDAQKITNAILNSPEINDIDDAFSVVRGSGRPSSHKKRSLGLSENPAFQQFVEQDLLANMSNAARSAARYVAYEKYIGKDNKIINSLLTQMAQQGASIQEVNKLAAGIKDYLDAESGNYKRPTTEAGQRLMDIQKNFLFVTALAGLPLATISSFVELMLVNSGLSYSQIFSKHNNSIKSIAREGSSTIWQGIKDIGKAATGQAITKEISTPGKVSNKELGYYSWDVGAATTTGATEVNKFRQETLDKFFTVTGLQGWTNYTRAARGAIGADFIIDKLETITNYKKSGDAKTNEVVEAEEALLNIGIDPYRMADISNKINNGISLDESEVQLYDESIRDGVFNFVNNAVALPQAANRPLIYQDPRLALFTQFNGFIATFTAHHIPKMWNEYIKRGTPAMKYNVFAVATTMILLGFMSQELKDRIKFLGENPYLEPHEKARRAVYASGLLGSGERVVDFFFPLYGEERTQGALDWSFKTVRDESPALSNIRRLGQAGGEILGGDLQEGVRKGLKVAPVVGPLNEVNRYLSHWLTGDWNYRGEG